jgi:dynein heavy chain
VDKKAAEVKVIYDAAMKDLNAVLPILQEAEDALKGLNPNDITLLKGTASPTVQVRHTLNIIYMLLERKTDVAKVEWK